MKTFIFDNDGTLIDTERIYFKSWQEMGDKYGFHFDYETKKIFNGKNVEESILAISQLFGFDLDTAEQISREMNERRSSYIKNHEASLYKPYALELIRYLKDQGYKLAMATASSKERLDFIYSHEECDIRPYFDVIVTGSEINEGKPNPEIFNRALEKLASSPDESYIVEDTNSGIEAANRAGATSVLILDLDRSQELKDQADLVFEDFKEFYQYLTSKEK